MGNFTGMWAIVEREVSRFMRVWQQTLVPPVVTSSLYILIFGFSLGSRISDIAGVSYLNFIIPGLLMMGVIMSAYMNNTSSIYISKFQGNIQEILVAPISYWQIITAYTISSVIRATIVGIGILVASSFFTTIEIHSIFIITYFILMVSCIFAFAGMATALWATSFDKMNVFTTFLITPLTYLGGVFYSINMLPPFWQSVAKFNPILYMVDGFRYGFFGYSDISLTFSMGLTLALAIFFFGICAHMFRTGYKLRD